MICGARSGATNDKGTNQESRAVQEFVPRQEPNYDTSRPTPIIGNIRAQVLEKGLRSVKSRRRPLMEATFCMAFGLYRRLLTGSCARRNTGKGQHPEYAECGAQAQLEQ
jgi:hypothetical protein